VRLNIWFSTKLKQLSLNPHRKTSATRSFYDFSTFDCRGLLEATEYNMIDAFDAMVGYKNQKHF